MQKLTLRMDAELVKSAKQYAALHGKSLSQLVADYFDDLTRQSLEENKLPPLTKSLKGVLADAEVVLKEDDYKQHLKDKYL